NAPGKNRTCARGFRKLLLVIDRSAAIWMDQASGSSPRHGKPWIPPLAVAFLSAACCRRLYGTESQWSDRIACPVWAVAYEVKRVVDCEFVGLCRSAGCGGAVGAQYCVTL